MEQAHETRVGALSFSQMTKGRYTWRRGVILAFFRAPDGYQTTSRLLSSLDNLPYPWYNSEGYLLRRRRLRQTTMKMSNSVDKLRKLWYNNDGRVYPCVRADYYEEGVSIRAAGTQTTMRIPRLLCVWSSSRKQEYKQQEAGAGYTSRTWCGSRNQTTNTVTPGRQTTTHIPTPDYHMRAYSRTKGEVAARLHYVSHKQQGIVCMQLQK